MVIDFNLYNPINEKETEEVLKAFVKTSGTFNAQQKMKLPIGDCIMTVL